MNPSVLEPTRDARHPPALSLERYAFDPPGTHRDTPLERHVLGCDGCRETVRVFQAERRAYLLLHPAQRALASVTTSRRPLVARWWLSLGSGLAAAALAVLLIWVRGTADVTDPVRLKGKAPSLEVHVSRGGAPATPWEPSRPVEPGDLLKFRVTPPADGYVVLLDVDARGAVEAWYGDDGGVRVKGGEATLLPGTIALDETPGPERLVLVFSEAPADVAALRAEVAQAFADGGGVQHMAVAHGVTVLLQKERR